MAIIESLIGAGSSLLGGILSGNQSEKNAEMQARERQQDRELQKEFAQNSIRWKSADALAAGISPYYALGAPTASYSPVSIGDGPISGIGKGLSDASQDLGRAAGAAMSQEERDDVAKKSASLNLEKAGLENELLKTQIAKMRGQIGPAMPTLKKAGEPGGNLIDGQPATQTTTVAGAPVKSDDIKQNADTIPKHNRMRIGGLRLYTNPHMSDAEDIETRYGDFAEKFAVIPNLAGDVYWTGKHYWNRYSPSYWDALKRSSSWRPRRSSHNDAYVYGRR